MRIRTASANDTGDSWNGFYAGGTVGGDWQNADTKYSAVPSPFSVVIVPDLANGAIPNDIKKTGSGFIGGATAGLNVQASSIVWGVEGDISWLGAKSTNNVAGGPPSFANPGDTTTLKTGADWLATARGRVGFLLTPKTLLYGTGGLAVGQVNSSSMFTPTLGSTCANNSLCSTGSGSSTQYGWTAGAGAETALTPRWSLKIEGLYYDLGNYNYIMGEASPAFAANAGAPNANVRVAVTGEFVRIGLNYKFGRL